MIPKSRTKGLAALVAALALTAMAAPATAQTGTIAGQVVDANSTRPLADAQVSVVGTGIGMLANRSGRFLLLNVPVGQATVRVDLIGYTAQEQTVTVSEGQTATLEFRISTTAISLDEIVVTGVGAETTRRALGTTVDVLRTDAIELAAVTSVDQLLKGRVAGATVSATSSQPGTGSLINFRGVSSVFGAQTPVIYVDGVRVDNDMSTAAGTGGEQSSSLSDLLVSDVERIEVTKGGAASTLYGSDAATGVIQIFTKKGTPGAPRITARIEQGVDTPELRYIFDTRTIFPDQVEAGEVSGTFLEDEFFQNGYYQNYYLGVSGGTQSVTYNVSGRLQDAEGVQVKNGSVIYALRGGVQADVSDRVRLDFSGSYTRSDFERLFNGTAIADPLTTFEVGDALFFSGEETLQGALDIFLLPNITEEVNRFIFSGGGTFDLTEDLSTRLNVGVDSRTNQQRRFEPLGFVPGEVTGELNRRQREFTSVSVDAAATYRTDFSDGAITSSTTVGAQGFRQDESIVNGNGQTFGLPGSFDFDEAATITAFEDNTEVFNGGLYLDEQIGLWDKLYLGGGFRVDAGSSFGDQIETELYPKGTVAYMLSEEGFFQDVLGGFVDELKLRGAYGETGKFPGAFLKDRTFSAVSFRGESAPTFNNPGNEDLKPEKTSTIEGGLDVALWSNRLGLNFTYYKAVTSDALFQVPEQPVTGLGTQQRNVGEITNKGIELAWNLQLLNRQSLAWSVGGTFQVNDNEVTDMGGVADFSVDGSQKRVTEGRPVGSWWVTTPLDTNGDGLNDGSGQRFAGCDSDEDFGCEFVPTPDKSGSFNTSVTLWNRVTVSGLADWAGGHHVFDWGSVWATFNNIYRRDIVPCGEGAFGSGACLEEFPIQYNLDGTERGQYSQSRARSAFIYDGDYFKFRELSARYVLPDDLAARLRASRASVYGSIRNVWIWSRNPLIDAELNGLSGGGLILGSESSVTLPPARSFKLGVEVVF